jgi:hypothetical protein
VLAAFCPRHHAGPCRRFKAGPADAAQNQ